MNHNKLYLIDGETYLAHFVEKTKLYSMLKQIAYLVKRLPSNRGSKMLSNVTEIFEGYGDEIYDRWELPDDYYITEDVRILEELAKQDLLTPEEAGYVLRKQTEEVCSGRSVRHVNALDLVDPKVYVKKKAQETLDIDELRDVVREALDILFEDIFVEHDTK